MDRICKVPLYCLNQHHALFVFSFIPNSIAYILLENVSLTLHPLKALRDKKKYRY
jgi:hypothetical protein